MRKALVLLGVAMILPASAEISAKTAGNPCASAGSAERIEYTDPDVMEICRDVVRKKVFDHGYIWSDFRSVSVDDSAGVIGTVSGTVMGETGGHQNLFRYSCQVDRTTGQVRSVRINGH